MIERLLIHFDVGPLGAAWRAALGFLLLPALEILAPGLGLGQGALALLVVLFCLKAVAALARRVLPATPAVRERWAWRRALAARYDSYQWRKLLWFGLGMLAAMAAGAGRSPWGWTLGAACAVSGVGGEAAWRRLGVGLSPPARA